MTLIINSIITVAVFYFLRQGVLAILEKMNYSSNIYYQTSIYTFLILFFIGLKVYPFGILPLIAITAFFLYRTYKEGYR